MKYLLLAILALPAFGAPMLASNPLAYNKLYLDADTVPWTASDDTIAQVWKLVADAYKPFNVDVTTIDPGPRPDVAWLVIGGAGPGNGVRGVSGIGTWRQGTQFKPFGTAFAGFAYPDGLTIAEAADVLAHEPGHLFGLGHSTDDIMFQYVQDIPTTMPWDAANFAALLTTLGPASPPEVPEPSLLLWVGLVGLLCGSRRCRAKRFPRQQLITPFPQLVKGGNWGAKWDRREIHWPVSIMRLVSIKLAASVDEAVPIKLARQGNPLFVDVKDFAHPHHPTTPLMLMGRRGRGIVRIKSTIRSLGVAQSGESAADWWRSLVQLQLPKLRMLILPIRGRI